jgi:hypothetical protein
MLFLLSELLVSLLSELHVSLLWFITFSLLFSRILLCVIVDGACFDCLHTLGVGEVISIVVTLGTLLNLSSTLGVGSMGCLSVVAFSSDSRLKVRAGTLGLVVWMLVSFGGAVASSKVTRFCHTFCVSGSTCLGIWLSISSSFSSASICMSPLTFFCPFNAFVRSFKALTIVSAGVTVG